MFLLFSCSASCMIEWLGEMKCASDEQAESVTIRTADIHQRTHGYSLEISFGSLRK